MQSRDEVPIEKNYCNKIKPNIISKRKRQQKKATFDHASGAKNAASFTRYLLLLAIIEEKSLFILILMAPLKIRLVGEKIQLLTWEQMKAVLKF